jgi:hypothetical protein
MVRRIDLAGLRRAIIGTGGTISLDGGDVRPRHAEIAPEGLHGDVLILLHPLNGPVTVERGGRRRPVLGRWRLVEGDVIVIGQYRLIYHDIGSPLGPEEASPGLGEEVPWLI